MDLGRPQHELDHASRIDRWLGIGNRAEGREAAARGGECPRRDRLLVLEAGLAEVCVDVNEAGADDETTRVDGLVRARAGIGADFGDAAVRNHDIGDGVDAVRWVDYVSAADGQTSRHATCLLAPNS